MTLKGNLGRSHPLKWYIFLAILVNIRDFVLILRFLKLSFHGHFAKDTKPRVRESVR